MFYRLLYNPVTEYFIAGTGLSAIVIAQAASPMPSTFINVASMGTVVGILLWMQHAREQRQSMERNTDKELSDKREERLLKRIEMLEEGNDVKLHALIERQLQCATKTDALLVRVEETLATFNQTIRRFTEGRPCLVLEHDDHVTIKQTTQARTSGTTNAHE
jgi:hypothetical protein